MLLAAGGHPVNQQPVNREDASPDSRSAARNSAARRYHDGHSLRFPESRGRTVLAIRGPDGQSCGRVARQAGSSEEQHGGSMKGILPISRWTS